jgi:hypothetical protein
MNALTDFVRATATELGVPGVAAGVWADGREIHACHGVTSLENPLPVEPHTLRAGSTGRSSPTPARGTTRWRATWGGWPT